MEATTTPLNLTKEQFDACIKDVMGMLENERKELENRQTRIDEKMLSFQPSKSATLQRQIEEEKKHIQNLKDRVKFQHETTISSGNWKMWLDTLFNTTLDRMDNDIVKLKFNNIGEEVPTVCITFAFQASDIADESLERIKEALFTASWNDRDVVGMVLITPTMTSPPSLERITRSESTKWFARCDVASMPVQVASMCGSYGRTTITSGESWSKFAKHVANLVNASVNFTRRSSMQWYPLQPDELEHITALRLTILADLPDSDMKQSCITAIDSMLNH